MVNDKLYDCDRYLDYLIPIAALNTNITAVQRICDTNKGS